MTKRKKDPSKAGLSSPDVKGQGTTNTETGGRTSSSARHKKKKQDY
ncbi:YuzL family protein [Cytobacillus dafuensis]|uniref:YuzL family protein n=1 Tax=Cytobacillus dafuensis TaxID=1742359 RepID=A0A5B8Z4P0_CYTDA|nr:YuzL family protein [Cytobacillus dafuensis]QED47858.1 YuzL family protein [Cytobacillus dafuensis]